jgi:hypothetical protein
MPRALFNTTMCCFNTLRDKNIQNKLLTPHNSVLYEKLIVTQLVTKSPPFMETESSLPSSQEPATSPHPEPDESNPRKQ